MIQVRIASLEDVNEISCVLAASWKSAYRGIVHDEYLDSLNHNHWVKFLIDGIKNKNIVTKPEKRKSCSCGNDQNQVQSIFAMVLEQEEKIIGSAILSEDESKMNLISFYLLPEKIGYGFGHLFWTAIETELKCGGFTKCILDVLQDNHRAIRFYEAHGFLKTNKIINVALGEYEYTCNVYEKSLEF